MANSDEPEERHQDTLPPRPSRWGALTLQNVSLLIFGVLALAIVAVAVLTVALPYETGDPFSVPRTQAILLIAAIACLIVAWLDKPNFVLIGRGVKHLLSIHRAAVATFVVAGTATIGISIFVALAALFSGEIKRGLYALAAIEFLLKLAAVSAIIVLITLRKPSITRTVTAQKQTGEAGEEAVVAVETDQEDRGRLEFGSLAFAFSLVVIAGLIVPSEDLMRLASMFFGGDKKIEDYLPQRPLVTVEDGLSDQIVEAIEDLALISSYLDDLNSEDRRSLSDSMKGQVESVLYDLEIENAKRLGAWPLLEAICYDQQDTMIFSNSDNRNLADHLVYLSTEGLVEYPYGDVNSIKLTQYGLLVMSKYMFSARLPDCTASQLDQPGPSTTLAPDSTLVSRVREVNPSDAEETIAEASFIRTVTIGSGTIYRLSLPAGRYRVELQSTGRADPFLQLFDGTGALIDENDDDGSTGAFDSQIEFEVQEGDKYYLRTSSYDGSEGDARLIIEDAATIVDRNVDFAALQIAREATATPLAETALVPPQGAAFSFTAPNSGEYEFRFSREVGSEQGVADLVAVLFSFDGIRYTQIKSDDDGGTDGLPFLVATLEQAKSYVLVLKHFEQMLAEQVVVTVSVDPPLATVPTPSEEEAPTMTPPIDADGVTDSGGSQSDP
jgi:hypothetical protein